MAVAEPDWYALLEVAKDATVEDIKESYQRLVLKLHPDKNEGQKSDTFDLVVKGYRILSDPSERSRYDARQRASDIGANIWREVNEDEFEENILLCRCGGEYFLDDEIIDILPCTVECDTCSLSVMVLKKS